MRQRQRCADGTVPSALRHHNWRLAQRQVSTTVRICAPIIMDNDRVMYQALLIVGRRYAEHILPADTLP